MNRRNFIHSVSVTGVAALVGGGCSPATGTRPLIVGMELGSPPFEMTDTAGKPSGVSVDLAGELAKALGRPLVIENIAFDGLIASLKTGKIDLILSSMTRTEQRAESIDFSTPYAQTGLCLLVGKETPVKSIADLDRPDRVVAVKKGTTGHAAIASRLKQAKLLVLDQESAAVLEVAQGKADAFVYDQISVNHLWQRHRDTTRALLEPFQKEQWAIGLRKGDAALLQAVNRFLEDFRRTGGFDRLAERWLKEEKAAFTQQGIAFIF